MTYLLIIEFAAGIGKIGSQSQLITNKVSWVGGKELGKKLKGEPELIPGKI